MTEVAVAGTSTRPLVSVVVPLYNEEPAVTELVARLARVADRLDDRYAFEFVFVDDGSTDGTVAVMKQLAARESLVRIVALRRNYGQTAALQVGFEHAVGSIVISMDGDLQHFPEDIPLFLDRVEQGFDVVCVAGARSAEKALSDGGLRPSRTGLLGRSQVSGSTTSARRFARTVQR